MEKKKLLIFIIIITAIIFTGCAPESKPASGAASDLQARFEDMFDDAEPAAADGTVRFGEESPPESTEPEITSELTNAGADDPVRPQNTATEILSETEITEQPEETTAGDAVLSVPPPENEEKFVVTPSGKRYHVESCRHAQNVKEYLTREEAEAKGYDPCKTCKP